jgi:hypothetical protein
MYGNGKPSQAVQPAGTSRVGGATGRSASSVARSPVILSQEYRYVIGDLRRLGMLAAGIFAVLIVLGLIVR